MRKRWSDVEIEFMREFFSDLTNKEIADILDRTEISVIQKAFSLKLKKSDEHISNIRRLNSPNLEIKLSYSDFKKIYAKEISFLKSYYDELMVDYYYQRL